MPYRRARLRLRPPVLRPRWQDLFHCPGLPGGLWELSLGACAQVERKPRDDLHVEQAAELQPHPPGADSAYPPDRVH